MRSLYSILGVERGVTRKEIKRAYYAAAHDCHPDKCPNDEQAAARFRDISLAYTVLGDPASRKRYDLLGPLSLGLSPTLTDLSVLGTEGEQLAQALGTVVSGVMERFRRGRRKQAKAIDVHIDVAMALRGGSQELQMERTVPCEQCQSSHARTAPQPNQSASKQGLTARCSSCRGRGTRTETISWRLQVPHDSAPGTLLRMARAGSMGADLMVRLVIDPHPAVLCRGLDLFVDVPIFASSAPLGGPLAVRLPHKTVTLTLPPGSQGGDQFIVANEGLKGSRLSKRGSLHITLDVEAPVHLSDEARMLWQQLAAQEAREPAHYPKHAAFLRHMQT